MARQCRNESSDSSSSNTTIPDNVIQKEASIKVPRNPLRALDPNQMFIMSGKC